MELPRIPAATLHRLSRLLLALTSIFFLLLFLYCAFKRLRYPFEMDRMESAALTEVWRIRKGLPLYTAPSLEYVPFLYAPLFFYMGAWISHLTGIGFTATRLVSLLATLGSFAAIYALVYREAKKHLPSLAAAGLFISLYSLLLGWYDVGRVDSLSVFFFLAALYFSRSEEEYFTPVIAAVLWVLAIQTKQSFLPIAPVAILAGFRRPRRMVISMAVFAALQMGSTWYLNRAFDGWYNFYVFGTAGQLHFMTRLAALYLPVDLMYPLGIALLITLAAMVLRPLHLRSHAVTFWGISGLVTLAAIGYVRAHDGANVNALIPVYALLCVFFGVGLQQVLESIEGVPVPETRELLSALVVLAAFVQIASHFYNTGRHTPQASQLAARQSFINQLRAEPGEVWVVNHSWANILADKPTHAELDSLDAIFSRPLDDKTRPTVDEVHQAYATGRLAAIVLDRPAESYEPRVGFISEEFRRHYGLAVRVEGSKGMEADQPITAYMPCSALNDAEMVRVWKLNSAPIDRTNCTK